jgi:5-formyltetrahydrofolate cyclo-ligase
VAAAFDMQVLDALPVDTLDHPVSMVVTEDAVYRC